MGIARMWRIDLFDNPGSEAPSESYAFRTFREIQQWLVERITKFPAENLSATFQVPCDANEQELELLRIIGPTWQGDTVEVAKGLRRQ
jgi:hypothetical protein